MDLGREVGDFLMKERFCKGNGIDINIIRLFLL